jgi:DNA-directed RNA polymerases I and III subunit RPAC2
MNKIEVINDPTNNEFSKTFCLNNEDHTLANPLRYMIMKNPNVVFCGYTVPHPSEVKVNLRIQTNKQITAAQALKLGLEQLAEVCLFVKDKFNDSLNEYQNDQVNPMED